MMSTSQPEDLGTQLEPRPRRGRATSTMVLAAVLVLAVGFLGGLLIGRHTASGGTNASGRFPRFNGTFPTPSGGFPGGFGNGASGANGVAIGTVTRIDGDTIYVETQGGSTVKVTAGADTQIRISKDGKLADLSKGSTIFVQGTRTGSGDLRASHITEGELGGFIPGPEGSSGS